MLRRSIETTVVLIAVAAVSLAAGTNAYAQGESYLELLRSDIKTQKTAILTEAMQLTDDQASVFWPVYREYDHELSKLGDKRVGLIKDYAKHYDSMTDEKAKELMESVFKIEEEQLKLKKKYFKKFEKELSSMVATRFFQVDNQINNLVWLQVTSELPLIKAPGE
jgi:DNA anti-recombination protein RmuC